VKCIHCHADAKYSERTNRTCPKCQHAFAFEPKNGDRLTDSAFQAALDRVSSDGTVKWTARHLYYELVRRTQRHSKTRPWLFGALAVVAALVGVFTSPQLLVIAGLLCVPLVLSLPSKMAKLSFADFKRLLDRWQQAHGQPKGLIVRKETPRTEQTTRALPSDIQHYSFDRAVVTDHRETVDLLLANNFHFENNCAILTEDGYPESAFEVVRGMLKNNPKLAVYVLHDATPQGCTLAQRLATDGWFQASASIVDVGLGPEHAGPFRGCWQAAKPATQTGLVAAGKPTAAKWLARYSLELAVVRPEQIIKRLFRALSNAAPRPIDDGGVIFVDSASFASDASTSDGGGDSFG